VLRGISGNPEKSCPASAQTVIGCSDFHALKRLTPFGVCYALVYCRDATGTSLRHPNPTGQVASQRQPQKSCPASTGKHPFLLVYSVMVAEAAQVCTSQTLALPCMTALQL